MTRARKTYPEDIQSRLGVEARELVRRGEEGGLLRRARLLVDTALRRRESRREVDLEALRERVRKLNEGVEPVVATFPQSFSRRKRSLRPSYGLMSPVTSEDEDEDFAKTLVISFGTGAASDRAGYVFIFGIMLIMADCPDHL